MAELGSVDPPTRKTPDTTRSRGRMMRPKVSSVTRKFAPRMLKKRSKPRRRDRSTGTDSPRYRRTAYSVIPPATTLLRIAVATNVAAERRTSVAMLELVNPAGDAGKIPEPDANVPRIARARRPAMSPFARARPKKTTKKFRKLFAQTSSVPVRMVEAVARRGGAGRTGRHRRRPGRPEARPKDSRAEALAGTWRRAGRRRPGCPTGPRSLCKSDSPPGSGCDTMDRRLKQTRGPLSRNQ